MKRKETTAIALKCFAIYVLSQVIIALPTFASLGLTLKTMGQGKPSDIWYIVIPASSVILGITTAFLIWKFTNSLLSKETIPDEGSGDLGIDGVMKIILACMGVYFVIDAVMALPYALMDFVISSRRIGGAGLLSFMHLLTQIIELSFGGLLIAKPGKWVKVIRSIGEI